MVPAAAAAPPPLLAALLLLVLGSGGGAEGGGGGTAAAGATVCDTANCGRGRCSEILPVPGIALLYKCTCDPGWSQIAPWLPFAPCTIPNCPIDRSCFNVTLEIPKGIPLTDPCVAVNCGPGGACTHGEGFSYTCDCQLGYVNLLNLTALPCIKNCAFGDSCAALGIPPPPPTPAPSTAPPPGLSVSSTSLLLLLLLLVASLAVVQLM